MGPLKVIITIAASFCLLLYISGCVDEDELGTDPRLAVIDAIAPAQGHVGDTVFIEGSQLDNVDSVFINGSVTNLILQSPTLLKIIVPDSAQSGPVAAHNLYGFTIGPDFTVLDENTDVIIVIDSLSSTSGTSGDIIKIYGKGFTALRADFELYFNTSEATRTLISDKEITATIPENASSGAVKIINDNNTITGPVFILEDDPVLVIQSISPTSGPELTEVTIKGQNFGSNKIDIEVTLNDAVVTVGSVNDTQIKFIVPQGATSGSVTVKNNALGQEVIGPMFTVLPPEPVITVGTVAGLSPNDNVGAPFQIVPDGNGNFYFTDFANHQIKKITANGAVTVYAGTGAQGFANGKADEATFNNPSGLDIDDDGNLYVADLSNHAIRKIAVGGLVSTVAGFGQAGFADGFAQQQAQFNQPIDVAVDGNLLFVSDFGNHAIRQLNMQTDMVTTLAGNGSPGLVNGDIKNARFNFPIGITLSKNKNILIADGLNHSIRLLNLTTNKVSTFMGTGSSGFKDGGISAAQFNLPYDVGVDKDGTVYVADRSNHRICKISNAITSTLAGTGTAGFKDGPADQAEFNNPYGLAVVSDNEIWVCDFTNGLIRKITIE